MRNKHYKAVKMTIANIISLVALSFSIVFSVCSMFFSIRGNKRTDTKDIESRARENAELNCKLDIISKNTADIKYDISAVKKDVQAHGEKIVELDASVKSAHHRIDGIETRLNNKEATP